MTVVGFRTATAADSEFCYALHKAAMGDYVTAIWGWDEAAQWEYHLGKFTPGEWLIITCDGVDVGLLCVEYRDAEIYLGRIAVHPDYQGRGIGTRVITALLRDADRRGQDLVLDVLAVNPRARALYLRLGLREVGRHGDADMKIAMRYRRSDR